MAHTIATVPKAKTASREYRQALSRHGVPYICAPQHDDAGRLVGLNVGVDIGGPDAFSRWILIPYSEDGLHGPGILMHDERPWQVFERASLPMEQLAASLAAARANEVEPRVVHKGCDVQILEFVQARAR